MSRLIAAMLVTAGTLLTGCNPVSMATTAFKEIRGAHGKLHLIADLPRGALDSYQSIRFEPATSTVGPKITPPTLLQKYDEFAPKAVTEDLKESFPGGTPVLTIQTELMYFQKKGLFSGGECLARVKGRDGDKLIFDSLLRTESAAYTRGGESAMAEASAKAVAKFLDKRKKHEEEKEDKDDKDDEDKDK